MVTVAPTIAPPVVSVIMPTTVPFEVWALATVMLTNNVSMAKNTRLDSVKVASPKVIQM
jgi:hypothetical protein